jgi:hypothetical protein
MALHDNAVVTAALGYVYVGPVGTARPSPADLKTLNVLTFGSDTSYTLALTGAPTGGTFILKTGTGAGKESAPIAWNATGDQIRAELEKLIDIGVGNVIGHGTLADPAGVTITYVGKLQTGSTVVLTATTTGLTGGTTPTVTVTKVPLAAGGAWRSVGHTSRDDLPAWGFDGGGTEVKGSWQNASLREVVTEQAADYCTMRLLQFDTDAMELYYGLNKSTTPGVFGVADGTSVPVEKSLFIVIVDGDHRVGFYSPKSSFRRDDSIELAVDEFATFPIRATFMSSGSPIKYEWIVPTD